MTGLRSSAIAFPDRLKGIAMVNLDNVQTGIKEMERCARMGLVGTHDHLYTPPRRGPYDSSEYEPLWAAAQDLEMPLSLHISHKLVLAQSQKFVHLLDRRVAPSFACPTWTTGCGCPSAT